MRTGPDHAGRIRDRVDRSVDIEYFCDMDTPNWFDRQFDFAFGKEHVGHLSLLEPLWRTRIEDIRDKKPVLTPADLSNRATSEAGFNGHVILDLLGRFDRERDETLALLDNIDASDHEKTSLHPRLSQQMRIIELFT
jgi:hypothetical protein